MNIEEFADATGLYQRSEIERTRLVAFYELRMNDVATFTANDIAGWFHSLGLAKPNKTRLANRLRASSQFIRGNGTADFRLHAREVGKLDLEFPHLREPSEAVTSQDSILSRELYEVDRGYIDALAKQINASYENNIFDGCAVLMRRLLEILLIHSYQSLGIESDIQIDGHYKDLSAIIADAKTNKMLKLSKDSRATLDIFRKLGNFSAHKIFYTCRRGDIRNVVLEYRVTIEELLYKSGLRT